MKKPAGLVKEGGTFTGESQAGIASIGNPARQALTFFAMANLAARGVGT
jgi:hypothetical protein